jgi:uncharacterized membrane protein
MAKVVERNISALLERRKQEEDKKTSEERIADKITRFTGSMLFVYIHLTLFGIWILWNSGLFNVPMFDPSYVVLAMFASVEAIFLSTFVLISQNRMNLQADKRAELDLQISLLTEHEVTRLISMVDAIAEKIGVNNPHQEEIEELAKDVLPEKVIDTMEKFTREHEDENRKKNRKP